MVRIHTDQAAKSEETLERLRGCGRPRPRFLVAEADRWREASTNCAGEGASIHGCLPGNYEISTVQVCLM
jgi:hypothetical protein